MQKNSKDDFVRIHQVQSPTKAPKSFQTKPIFSVSTSRDAIRASKEERNVGPHQDVSRHKASVTPEFGSTKEIKTDHAFACAPRKRQGGVMRSLIALLTWAIPSGLGFCVFLFSLGKWLFGVRSISTGVHGIYLSIPT